MRDWVRRRPWIWLVILYLAVMAAQGAFVWIAERNPTIPADVGPPPLPPG